MKLVVGNWVIDPSDNQITHTETNQVVKLEPRAMAVLAYFMQKPGVVISRDELIEQIWDGRIVSDHAIYRVINQIRKALDVHDMTAYLITLSKKGYKLIQPVTNLVEDTEKIYKDEHLHSTQLSSSVNEVTKALPEFAKYGIFFGIILLSIFVLWKTILEAKWSYYSSTTYANFVPVITDDGVNDYPHFSADGKFIVFTRKSHKHGRNVVYAKRVDDNNLIRISDELTNIIHPVSSSNLEVVVAQEKINDQCNVIVLNKNEENTYSKSVLFGCNENLDIDYDINFDGTYLYHSFKDDVYNTSRIFSYEVATGKRELISENIGNNNDGDTQVSLSPSEQKIAYLRDFRVKNSTSIVVYDFKTKKEKVVRTFDANIVALDWDNTDEFLIYQKSFSTLSKFSLKFGFSVPIISTVNTKIEKFDHSSTSNKLLMVDTRFQSKVYEVNFQECQKLECSISSENVVLTDNDLSYYPVYANNDDRFVYVSRKSGQQELWIRELDGSSRQLTSLSQKEVISHFEWSYDDDQIVFNTLDSIYIVETLSGNIQKVLFSEDIERGYWPTWNADGTSIYFNNEVIDNLDLYQYEIANQNLKKMNLPELGMFYNTRNENYFLYRYKLGLWKNLDNPTLVAEDIDFERFRSFDLTKKNAYLLVPFSDFDIVKVTSLDDSVLKEFKIIREPENRFSQFSVNSNETKLAMSSYNITSKDLIVVSP